MWEIVFEYVNPIAISRDFFLTFKIWMLERKTKKYYHNSRIWIGLQKCVRPIVQHLLSMRWKCSQLATLNVRVCHPQNIKQDNFFSHTNYSIRNEKVSECFSKDLGFSEKVKILPGRLNFCSQIAVSVCCDHVVPITTIQ